MVVRVSAGRRLRAGVVTVMCSAFVVVSCTGDDGSSASDGADTESAGADSSLTMTEVTAELLDGAVSLTWDPVGEATRYVVGGVDGEVEVPANICAESCALTLLAQNIGADGAISVSAATDDGAASEPSVVVVELPAQPDDEAELSEDDLEVLLVHSWDPTEDNSSPDVEVVPVDSLEEAERVIEEAMGPDSGVISASLNLPVDNSADSSAASASGSALATWYADAMRYDVLPGNPRGEGIVVGTIEAVGVDASHPSLAGAVRDGRHVDYWLLANANSDDGADDGDGDQAAAASDGVHNGVSNPGVHATAVASVVVGQPAGAVPGIAPGAEIYPINIGDGSEADMVRGIIMAVDAGVDIINISMVLGCKSVLWLTNCPTGVAAATDYAESKGVIVVAGAGNNGAGEGCGGSTNADLWPAVLDTVISVGGYAPSGEVYSCSPDRPDVDVLAPAVRMLIADVDRQDTSSKYAVGSGTSFAAPLISGLLAIVLAERPDLTPAHIRSLMPLWRDEAGRIDVVAVLAWLGLVDDPTELGLEDLAAVTPYTVRLDFDRTEPIAGLVDRVSHLPEIVTTHAWRGQHRDKREGVWNYTDHSVWEITGTIFLLEDGSVEATGAWRGTWPGRDGKPRTPGMMVLDGYQAWCHVPMMKGVRWPTKAVRWDIPVLVDAGLVPGTNQPGRPPEFELSFSLGEGATADEAGVLPLLNLLYNDLDRCEGYIGLHTSAALDSPWPEITPVYAEYFDTVQEINEELIAASPFTLDSPLVFSGDGTASVVENPDIGVEYNTDPACQTIGYKAGRWLC
ncbi:S8 family peptidase [Phytoactinopolyspora limicola]|uniref:S8 family peptidase n=1 Tax=Phytoactinopolyspora limicola TaxID=2715536 RepID=UPI001409C168|nr:S8 family serine peptidase [Phytoactinopolyspora limicola]